MNLFPVNTKLKVFTFFLVILPVISFFTQRFFSVQANQLELFSRHLMVNYADWLFIPFNLFVLWAADFSRKKLVVFLGISFILNIGINYYWSTLAGQGVINSHLFVGSQITIAGVIHFLFSWFQAGLVGIFFFHTKHNKYCLYCLLSLTGYALTIIYSSFVFHHGKPLITDIGLGIFLFILIGYKLIPFKSRLKLS